MAHGGKNGELSSKREDEVWEAKRTFITALFFFFWLQFKICLYIYCVCFCGGAQVWMPDNMLQELFICFHHMGPKGGIQVIRFNSELLFARPSFSFICVILWNFLFYSIFLTSFDHFVNFFKRISWCFKRLLRLWHWTWMKKILLRMGHATLKVLGTTTNKHFAIHSKHKWLSAGVCY